MTAPTVPNRPPTVPKGAVTATVPTVPSPPIGGTVDTGTVTSTHNPAPTPRGQTIRRTMRRPVLGVSSVTSWSIPAVGARLWPVGADSGCLTRMWRAWVAG